MDFVDLDEYKKETIFKIIEKNSRLNTFSFLEISELYRQWSNEVGSASWLMYSDRGIDAFIRWATTAPCDAL